MSVHFTFAFIVHFYAWSADVIDNDEQEEKRKKEHNL